MGALVIVPILAGAAVNWVIAEIARIVFRPPRYVWVKEFDPDGFPISFHYRRVDTWEDDDAGEDDAECARLPANDA